MEAFSDGMMAIIVTIMAFELRVPTGANIEALRPLIPAFFSYVMSFAYLAIYWNNHHHLLQANKRVDGRVLWANMHLLFWLSLIPFATAWVGGANFAAWPVAVYGAVLLMAAIAYYILTRALIALHGHDSTLATAVGRDVKGLISTGIYALAIPVSFMASGIAFGLYAFVAILWIIPDRRIENRMAGQPIEAPHSHPLKDEE